MTWVVDTCVIIDVLRGDETFSIRSSMALQSKLDDVLTIAPLTYVELAPEFNGDVEAQNAFLDGMWIHRDFNGSDIMIGAYAMQKGGLITRNESEFKTLYPNLTIFNPISCVP